MTVLTKEQKRQLGKIGRRIAKLERAAGIKPEPKSRPVAIRFSPLVTTEVDK